jgi:hypothetical protein
MMKLRIAVVAGVVAASAMTSAFAQSPGATVSRKMHLSSICGKSYDPYREPVSILRSCGDVIMRLRHVTPLQGGGKAYDYGAYTQFVPPPHFNVLKASDRQLQEYALPTRQKLGSRWYAIVGHIRHFVRPAPYLVGIPADRIATSAVTASTPSTFTCNPPTCAFNWSGYVAYYGHSYNYVAAGWYEPHFVSGSCSSTEFSQWVGIGGSVNAGRPGDLGQDGTAFGEPGIGPHQAWIETIVNDSNSPPIAIKKLFATVGEKFTASTQWVSASKKYAYTMTNSKGDAFSGESRKVSSKDLSSAEVISERPTLNDKLTDLTPYRAFQVTNPAVGWSNGDSSFVNLSSSDETPMVMKNQSTGNLMAFPGPLNLATSDFSSNYLRCDG